MFFFLEINLWNLGEQIQSKELLNTVRKKKGELSRPKPPSHRTGLTRSSYWDSKNL